MRQLRPTRKPFNSPVFRRVYIVFFPIFRISITSIGVKIPGNSFSESFPVKHTINDLPIANYLIVALVWFFCPRKMYIIPMKSRRTGRCRALASPYGIFCLQGTEAQALLKNQAKPSKSAFGEKGVMRYAVYAVGRYPGRSGGVCGIPAPQALYCLGKGEANKGNFNRNSGPAGHFY